MKQPTVQQMKSLLIAAAILTMLQMRQDNSSIDIAHNMLTYIDNIRSQYPELNIAHNMWTYIDNIRSQYPELKNVHLPL